MHTIEAPKTFNKIIDLFYHFGMWEKEGATRWNKAGWSLFHILLYSSYVFALASGTFVTDDWGDAIFLVAIALEASVCWVKMFYIIFKKDKIFSFIRDIITHTVYDRQEFIKINKKCKLFMCLVMGFPVMTSILMAVLVGLSLPVFSSEKRLIYPIAFPLDWRNSEFAYWIAYGFLIASLADTWLITLFNVVIWYVMLNCSIKYEVLGNQFRNMGAIRTTTTISTIEKRKFTIVEKQQLFHQDLLAAIKAHKNIQDTINKFKSLFSNLFMAQITISGISICGSIFIVLFTDQNAYQYLINLSFLGYYFFDIFMIMYLGNEIKTSSDGLTYCLFESDWINQSKSSKNCILVLTEVLKQPHELVIYKLYPLNLETFTRIMRFSYSSINILQNFT